MIHEDVWQEIRILAIRERKEIGELVEEIFRERLERTYKEHPELQQPRLQSQSHKPQSPPQTRQLQTKQSQIQLQKFYEEDAPVIEPGGVQRYDGYFTMLWLPGIRFPIHTSDLIKYHWDNIQKSFDKVHISKFKEKFSNRNRTYWRKDELEEDLKAIFDIDMDNKGKPGRMVDCILISDEDETTANQHFIEEQVKRVRESGLLAPQDMIDKLPYVGGLGVDFPITLPEIKYPINKDRLIQLVKEFQKEFHEKYNKIPFWMDQTLFIMENLPDSNKSYRNLGRLMDDLKSVVHDRNLKSIEHIKKLLLEKRVLSGKSRNIEIGVLGSENAKNNWMRKIIEKDDILRQLYNEQQEREQQQEKPRTTK